MPNLDGIASMDNVAISVRNVSKRYHVYENQRARLCHALWPSRNEGMSEVWALQDINFAVKRGDSVAIIGRNDSGEINYRVDDVTKAIEHVLEHYLPQDPLIDRTDGVSVEFSDWRFNLRGSNTELLLRLNVETKDNTVAVVTRVNEIERLIKVVSMIKTPVDNKQ